MDSISLIQAALTAPKTHCVLTTYADGVERRHETRSAASAETFAVGERRKIGLKLIDRETGRRVEVIEVTVTTINAPAAGGARCLTSA